MAEKRKSVFVFLLKKTGTRKCNKVEIFNCRDFGYYSARVDKYRLRANGKWFPKGRKQYFSMKEIMKLIYSAIINL
jgi:hypothetical protein